MFSRYVTYAINDISHRHHVCTLMGALLGLPQMQVLEHLRQPCFFCPKLPAGGFAAFLLNLTFFPAGANIEKSRIFIYRGKCALFNLDSRGKSGRGKQKNQEKIKFSDLHKLNLNAVRKIPTENLPIAHICLNFLNILINLVVMFVCYL